MTFKHGLVLASILLALAGCKSDDDPENGTLALAITDAPVDGAKAVVVEFTGIEIQGAGERLDFNFDSPKKIDLLQLTGEESLELLPEKTVNTGQYQWIRLKVNANQGVTDSYIDIDGARYSLYIPSGAQTGLKLNRPFTIAAGGITDMTIDFDLRKSVHVPQNGSGDYFLRPTLRIVDNLEVGHINGLVDETLLNVEGCSAASGVYLFAGYDAETDDIDASEPEPITTSTVEMNTDGFYEYEIGFIQAGDYTLAFTCEAANDDPETDDSINFSATQNVTVTVDETATVDF